MSTFRIEISLDNDAFATNQDSEIARILHRLAGRIVDHGALVSEYVLRDYNGNTVGVASFEDDGS